MRSWASIFRGARSLQMIRRREAASRDGSSETVLAAVWERAQEGRSRGRPRGHDEQNGTGRTEAAGARRGEMWDPPGTQRSQLRAWLTGRREAEKSRLTPGTTGGGWCRFPRWEMLPSTSPIDSLVRATLVMHLSATAVTWLASLVPRLLSPAVSDAVH